MKTVFIYVLLCIAFAPLVLLACDNNPKPPYLKYVEVCEATPEHRDFIVARTAAGNPMSDEEGEDLVAQCEKTARHLFNPTCSLKSECYDKNHRRRPLDECGVHIDPESVPEMEKQSP